MAGGPPAPSIPVGSRVKLKGLTGTPYLNGAVGEVSGPPTREPETDPPRYPVRLLAPARAVASHPQGVRVKAANLDVTELPSLPVELRLTELQRAQPGPAGAGPDGARPLAPPFSPADAGPVAAAFVRALEEDQFPQEGLEGLFATQPPTDGKDGTTSGDLRRCKAGQLALGAWQELLQHRQAEVLTAAVRACGAGLQELQVALMCASIGGFDALRAVGGAKHGPKLAAAGEAVRSEFAAGLAAELQRGGLPEWFEAAVRQCTAARVVPGLAPPAYCPELCRRGFDGLTWDRQALAGLKA
ncbi:hypothetical protein HYH03_017127 [Edaphochlamys debaryana]|uniref:Uncharacterized protein n=1 Tax=Edaphochlamys debaryana TaxID=47281 RepID=A0A835XG86_9CHLO|nr:hypothetical protein HYH03_017127 [Edaphochlamys debaryana]|eukprot:KAG2484037.1 hypothetical protein HYH03_017127 [Edaphochlamys debaryana]